MQAPLIINADCTHICISLWLTFSLHLMKKKNFTPGPSARVGIFNFGTDRVSGIFAKKILIEYFRVLEILIGYFRVHPNVVQFLYIMELKGSHHS